MVAHSEVPDDVDLNSQRLFCSQGIKFQWKLLNCGWIISPRLALYQGTGDESASRPLGNLFGLRGAKQAISQSRLDPLYTHVHRSLCRSLAYASCYSQIYCIDISCTSCYDSKLPADTQQTHLSIHYAIKVLSLKSGGRPSTNV